jgi:hypothetical protein
MSSTTNSGNTNVQFNQHPRTFFSTSFPSINTRAANLLGTSVTGIPFVPNYSGTFKSTTTTGNNFFNDFQTKNGNITNQIRQFGINNSIPYLSAYTTINSGTSGLNFTRLAGIDLRKDTSNPTYANLKPGFKLNQNQNIYAINLTVTKKASQSLNRYNHDILTSNSKILLGYIFTRDQIELNIGIYDNNGNYTLKILDPNNLLNLENEINPYSQRDLQNSIYKNRYNNTIFNFKKNDKNFFWRNVLNLNTLRLNELGYSFVYYNDVINDLMDSCDIVNCTCEKIELEALKDFNQEYQYAKTPWIVSQGFYSAQERRDRSDLSDRVKKLFRIHAINPDRFSNNLGIKIIPVSLGDSKEYAKFHLHLIDIRDESVIYQFDNLNFNQDSPDFIGRVIGTQNTYFDIISKKVVTTGLYPQQNPWIRVEMSDFIMNNHSFNINTIPAGFLAHPSLKQFTQNNVQTGKEILNYVRKPQLQFEAKQYRYNNLLANHTWGKNFKKIEYSKTQITDTQEISVIFKEKTAQNVFNITTGDANLQLRNLYRYSNDFNESISENTSSSYLYEYLNNNFFNDVSGSEYLDMFHLEKIYLLNEMKGDNIFQRWDLAKYQHSGAKILSFINNTDIGNLTGLFSQYNESLVDIFYYFTINQRSVNKSFGENVNAKYFSVDAVEEAVGFNEDVNILSFTTNLSGGFDGLNIFDENQYAINDIGLNESQYLREIYKLGLDVIVDESTCLNSFTYLPEIYNSDVVDHVLFLANENINITFLLDKPLLNINEGIIYCKNLLTYDVGGNSSLFDNWYLQKFKYRYNSNNRIPVTLAVDKDNTINNLRDLRQLSNVAYFSNYVLFKVDGVSGNNPFEDGQINREMMLPAGLIAFCLISNSFSTPLTAYNIGSLSDFKLSQTYYSLIDYDNINDDENKRLINSLSCNFFHYVGPVSGGSKYSFYSNKTSVFMPGVVGLLSRLHIRLILSEIKRLIRYMSYALLFDTRISDVSTVSKLITSRYALILNEKVNQGMISEFQIKLDETTTSTEDLLNNLIRGSIFLKFVGSENVEVIKIDV